MDAILKKYMDMGALTAEDVRVIKEVGLEKALDTGAIDRDVYQTIKDESAPAPTTNDEVATRKRRAELRSKGVPEASNMRPTEASDLARSILKDTSKPFTGDVGELTVGGVNVKNAYGLTTQDINLIRQRGMEDPLSDVPRNAEEFEKKGYGSAEEMRAFPRASRWAAGGRGELATKYGAGLDFLSSGGRALLNSWFGVPAEEYMPPEGEGIMTTMGKEIVRDPATLFSFGSGGLLSNTLKTGAKQSFGKGLWNTAKTGLVEGAAGGAMHGTEVGVETGDATKGVMAGGLEFGVGGTMPIGFKGGKNFLGWAKGKNVGDLLPIPKGGKIETVLDKLPSDVSPSIVGNKTSKVTGAMTDSQTVVKGRQPDADAMEEVASDLGITDVPASVTSTDKSLANAEKTLAKRQYGGRQSEAFDQSFSKVDDKLESFSENSVDPVRAGELIKEGVRRAKEKILLENSGSYGKILTQPELLAKVNKEISGEITATPNGIFRINMDNGLPFLGFKEGLLEPLTLALEKAAAELRSKHPLPQQKASIDRAIATIESIQQYLNPRDPRILMAESKSGGLYNILNNIRKNIGEVVNDPNVNSLEMMSTEIKTLTDIQDKIINTLKGAVSQADGEAGKVLRESTSNISNFLKKAGPLMKLVGNPNITPDKQFNRLMKNTDNVRALKEVLSESPEQWTAIRNTWLDGMIKRSAKTGEINYPATRAAIKRNKDVYKILFGDDMTELDRIIEFGVRLGDRIVPSGKEGSVVGAVKGKLIDEPIARGIVKARQLDAAGEYVAGDAGRVSRNVESVLSTT